MHGETDGRKATCVALQLCADAYQLAPVMQYLRRIVDHVVHDGLSGQDVVDQRGDVAHQECDRRDRLLRVLLHLVLIRYDTLRRELLDLRLAIVLPVVDVRRPTHAHRAAGVDERAHDIAVVRA